MSDARVEYVAALKLGFEASQSELSKLVREQKELHGVDSEVGWMSTEVELSSKLR